MNVFIAAQSLKGTIESKRAAELFSEVFGNADIQAVSDGGNGFLDVIKERFPKGIVKEKRSLNPNGDNVNVPVYETEEAVYIESAKVLGLKRNERGSSLFRRKSEGLGILIADALNGGKEIVVGLGGSSTVDMGGKLLERLGAKVEYHPFTFVLKSVSGVKKIKNLTVVPDVFAPINGDEGAVMFAEQKGASEGGLIIMRKMFDEAAERYNAENIPYLGSAGGVGLALWMAGGKFVDNFEYFDKMLNLRARIERASAVVTCEGHLDRQSFKGKITGKIMEYAVSCGKPVYIVAGKQSIKDERIRTILIKGHFKKIFEEPEKYFLSALKTLKEELDDK